MKWFYKIVDLGHCSCGYTINFFHSRKAGEKELKEHLQKWHTVNRETWFIKQYTQDDLK